MDCYSSRLEKDITTLIVHIEDKQADVLRKKADRFGLGPEQFLKASVEDLIGQPDADFDKAVNRVLSKNQELYRRLA